jgi:hypothetical protein
VKNLLLSYCGFEIEMKGIPDKLKKEIETLMWDFIWEGKVKQKIFHNYSFTFVGKFSAFPNLYTIFHSINNVLPNFIIDTQLFNKDERSVEKSFDILSKYEKASGSRINYNKTKAISIGNARHRKPKFNKISWIKENVKTLGYIMVINFPLPYKVPH